MAVKVLLKEIRTSRGISQNKLAQQIGMTLQNLQNIEYGKSKGIQYGALNKLCQVLNCQPGDLLVFVSDDNDGKEAISEQEEIKELKRGRKSIDDTLPSDDTLPLKRQTTCRSYLNVIREVPESA